MSARTELASRISGATGISRTIVDEMLGALSDIALDEVMNTGVFTVPGVAKIRVYERPPMDYVDVNTGDHRAIGAGYKVVAAPSSRIRAAVHEASIRRGHPDSR